MSINSTIITALQTLGVPVSFQSYKGTSTTYVTFFEYLQQGESFSEDQEEITGHYLQVDVWSKGNYESIVDQAKVLLKVAGFKRTNEIDLYETDTQTYHKGMRFFYAEEI